MVSEYRIIKLALLVLRAMLNSGCTKQTNILMAFHTYMELCEVHVLKNVKYDYCRESDLIYLTATDEDEEIYVPVSVKENISPQWIENIQTNVCKDRDNKVFNLVIRDSDTTTAIYKISPGLVPPLSPDSSRKKKLKEEQKQFIENDILKRVPELYREALKVNKV